MTRASAMRSIRFARSAIAKAITTTTAGTAIATITSAIIERPFSEVTRRDTGPGRSRESERQHVGVLHDEPAARIRRRRGTRQLLVVEHDEQIAERPVDDVEPHVRAELFQVGV